MKTGVTLTLSFLLALSRILHLQNVQYSGSRFDLVRE